MPEPSRPPVPTRTTPSIPRPIVVQNDNAPSGKSENASLQTKVVPTSWGTKPLAEEVTGKVNVLIRPNIQTAQTPEPHVPGAEAHHDAVLFLRGILSEGIRRGISDVHFEPHVESYSIRFRVDGVLNKYVERPREQYSTLLNTVKVLADLDIATHHLPQDGHIELVLQEIDRHLSQQAGPGGATQELPSLEGKKRYYDIRVSIFPSVNGEVVVMRVLNRDNALLTVEELGMDMVQLEQLRGMLVTSYGMMLVTGPTGSGKTTTLYSILSELKSKEKNIITLEDPIEFHLDWMRQCEINEERGFTFEKAMTSVLRQDPDVLMVGEIRDPSTAEYAVRSALVGRIVGSTIHANTAIGTIARMLELGIQRSLLAHTVNGVIAQRLTRKVCVHCKEEYEPSQLHLAHLGLQKAPGPFLHGKGCDKCNQTGFLSRTGIFSTLVFDDRLRGLIFDQRPLVEIQDYAIKQGMRTLKMDAASKVLAGITTAEEATRVV
jgi:type IV pilus assembly protein PilB